MSSLAISEPDGGKGSIKGRLLFFASRIKKIMSGKGIWVNAGPVLVLGLLIFCIAFTMNAPQAQEAGAAAETGGMLDGEVIQIEPAEDQAAPSYRTPESIKLVDGWGISVGEEHIVFLASKAEAEEVLENVKMNYLPEGGEATILNAEFIEPVGLSCEAVLPGSLSSPEEAFAALTEGKETIQEYEVRKGDNYWDIAVRNDLTVDELMLINGAENNKLQIGDILKLNRTVPLLSVKATICAVGEESIPYGTVYKDNSEAWQGQNKVLSAGVKGSMEVEYEIDQINGVAVERRVLSETVIADPIDQIVEKGTKAIAASRGAGDNAKSGALAWPIRGKINSPFGSRSRGFHSGIDIQAKTGDPIYSAAAGTVIMASYSGGYGNLVTVDHGDGLTTLYAHLSKINVKVGQVIGDQELVGLAGTTGRTTGPHLHFEVRINGSPVNPVNYLN